MRTCFVTIANNIDTIAGINPYQDKSGCSFPAQTAGEKSKQYIISIFLTESEYSYDLSN